MKTKFSAIIIAAMLTAGAGFYGLVGCASLEQANTQSLLSAAGFQIRTPQTPKQQQMYAAAPSYKVLRATINGKIFYAYKDEKNGVAYVGHEAEYQRYCHLAIQQRIAQDNYMAAEMDRQTAMGWYGAYGRRGLWW